MTSVPLKTTSSMPASSRKRFELQVEIQANGVEDPKLTWVLRGMHTALTRQAQHDALLQVCFHGRALAPGGAESVS